MDKAVLAHVEQVLGEGDPDRMVASFFAPVRVRPALMALYAFDHEVSRVGWTAREPMAGHIRLAWWREQLAMIYGGAVPQAPVARALGEAALAHRLPRDVFETYLDARAHDLDEAPFGDEAAFDAYAAAVCGGVLRLAVRVLGAEDRADGAVGHAATAVACAAQVRELAFLAARRRCRLPLDWLAAEGASAEDAFAGTNVAAVARVCGRLAAKGRAALAAVNAARFPTKAMPALSVAALARPVFARAGDAKAPPMPAWQRVARLAFANLSWRV